MTYLPCRLLAALVLLVGVAGAFTPSNARAETYHTCAGFIDSVPTTITQQGVWCLRKDLSTNITNGNAITIAANNVTIDCNDFKVGGLAAGDASRTIGIAAQDRQNATVRNCNVRGFFRGISLSAGAGHLIEDNRLDNNLYTGIFVNGENNLVQRNRVFDTGGSLIDANSAVGIFVVGDVIDNTVAGVLASHVRSPRAIWFEGTGSVARNNRVRGLEKADGDSVVAILFQGSSGTIDGNQVTGPGNAISGSGLDARGVTRAVCKNNVISGFSNPFSQCKDGGNNTTL